MFQFQNVSQLVSTILCAIGALSFLFFYAKLLIISFSGLFGKEEKEPVDERWVFISLITAGVTSIPGLLIFAHEIYFNQPLQ